MEAFIQAVQESEEKIATDKFDSDFKIINDFNDIKEELAEEGKTEVKIFCQFQN